MTKKLCFINTFIHRIQQWMNNEWTASLSPGWFGRLQERGDFTTSADKGQYVTDKHIFFKAHRPIFTRFRIAARFTRGTRIARFAIIAVPARHTRNIGTRRRQPRCPVAQRMLRAEGRETGQQWTFLWNFWGYKGNQNGIFLIANESLCPFFRLKTPLYWQY